MNQSVDNHKIIKLLLLIALDNPARSWYNWGIRLGPTRCSCCRGSRRCNRCHRCKPYMQSRRPCMQPIIVIIQQWWRWYRLVCSWINLTLLLTSLRLPDLSPFADPGKVAQWTLRRAGDATGAGVLVQRGTVFVEMAEGFLWVIGINVAHGRRGVRTRGLQFWLTL